MTALHPLVGHEDVRRSLAAAHLSGGLPASLLLHGLQGVGKQRMAHWIAQLTFCEAPGPEGPCGACRPCRLSLGLEHPDVHWYFPLPRPKGASGDRLADALETARIDAVNERKARPIAPSVQDDEIRGLYLGLIQGLRRKANVRPSMADIQVFIVADAEYMVPQEASPEAANALLKLLEEPPAGTRFILTSSEPGRLLPTIRSRSVPLHLSPLPRQRVADFLVEHRGVDDRTARWAATLGQGSVGRALGFLPDGDEDGILEGQRQQALQLVEAALAEDRASGYAHALSQSSFKARTLVGLFAFVEEWLRDLAAVTTGAEEKVLSQDVLPHLRELTRKRAVHPSALAASLPALEEARELARGNVNPQLILSGLVRRLRKSLRPAPAHRG